jgi:farnesyl diphosphate synthase
LSPLITPSLHRSKALSHVSFPQALRHCAEAVERCLDEVLAHPVPAPRLREAMRYSLLGPGKRIRAFLLVETAGMFDVAEARSLRAAAALECLHAYSLIHDDLPAMDDDDTRRGKPACHIAFDQATAILAGDALQTLAFELLADPATHPDALVRSSLIGALAKAAGVAGMVGGQMLDMQSETRHLEGLVTLMELKTGALFAFALEAGALLGNASAEQIRRLSRFGSKIGLAFQIADDILDHTATGASAIGLKPGKTVRTIVDILGLPGAKARADALAAEAARELAAFGDRAAMLRTAAQFIVERQH